MSYSYSYVIKNLNRVYPGGKHVLKDITLSFIPGAKIGVIGPNGAGKSTLMKIIAGYDKDFTGEAFAGPNIVVGYLPQEPQLDENLTVAENIAEGLKSTKDLLKRFEEISNEFANPEADIDALLQEQSEVQEKIEAVNGWELDRTIEIAMDALRCPPNDYPVNVLSGGEKRRVALCRLLLSNPDILILDEPTNHLDAESVGWLEKYLQGYKGTVILVTHDRYFLDNVVKWILEIDRGQAFPFEGNYSEWLDYKRKRLEVEAKQETARQKVLEKELEWIRSSVKARQTKSKARIEAYEELCRQTSEKMQTTEQVFIPEAPKLGNKVVEFENVSKSFGDEVLIKNLSFLMPRGAIVGIIGPNGAGKTTFFKMITGKEQPDSGTITIGETVKLGYIDQSRHGLHDDKNVWEEISGGHDEIVLGKRKVVTRAYCSQFNFKGTDQQKKVGLLSGGERNRVHLAKMLLECANLLLLDEPTNDLDVDTLRALEDGLLDFNGCAMVISHDRWFLDRIATHILAFEGDGEVVWFEGNYQDYEKDKVARLGEIVFKKPKYKPLIR